MKTKSYLIAVTICTAIGGMALAQDVTRDVVAGDWSTATEWDTDALPGPSNRAVHPTARGTLALDTGLDPGDRVIDAFLGNGGGNPRSVLMFETLLDLTVNADYTTTRALGLNYRTFLLDENELTVGGAIVGGDWFIDGTSTIDAESIDLTNANWTIDVGIVSVNNDMSDDSGQVTVNDDGVLQVGIDGSGNLLANAITINTGGLVAVDDNVDADTKLEVDGGILTAATAGTSTEGVGQFLIEHDGTVTITGETSIPGGSSLEYGEITSSSNSLDVGSLNFSASTSQFEPASGASAPSLGLTVGGDLDVATTGASMNDFNPSGVALTFDAGGSVDFEIFSTDYDVTSVGNIWYGVDPCGIPQITNARPLGSFVVKAGTTVNITDTVVNAYRAGYSQDALYVFGDVTVESGATLNLGSRVLYYAGTLSEPGTINGTRTPGTLRCYGDFDFDGEVDLGDFALFSVKFTGPGGATDDALYDSDLDGDVDLGDFAQFSLNFRGPGVPCPGTCTESSTGGGPVSLEDLANWCTNNLSTEQRADFADVLYAAAEEMGETEEAAELLDLADLITE